MRPCTLHYVVTLENSITLGRHFYARSTARVTVWGLIHCAIMHTSVTNADPYGAMILRRILVCSLEEWRKTGVKVSFKYASIMLKKTAYVVQMKSPDTSTGSIPRHQKGLLISL